MLLAMAPSPTLDHNMAAGELLFQMRTQLPSRLAAALDMDVDLQLVPGDQPATVRKPDLIVIERHERDRLRGKRGIVRAESVRLVVEIVSPGSRRMDYVIKRAEYAGCRHTALLDHRPELTDQRARAAPHRRTRLRRGIRGEWRILRSLARADEDRPRQAGRLTSPCRSPEPAYPGRMAGKDIDRIRARSAWATVKESPVIAAIAVAPVVVVLGVVWWLTNGFVAFLLLVLLGVGVVVGGKLLK
ncbi:Uma2 family endonuclease [Nocardia puris]|nr:Uma2 family endonuclease [Nocardia puris]